MSHAQRQKIPACLLSVDAEKAFDRVHWLFLRFSLAQIGIGPSLLGKLMALYQGPTARVMTNGILSSPVHVANGTRQGCPLSPLLYVLVMEHLAVAIRANPDIHGISISDAQHKLALYADDLLLYITDPLTSLPSLYREFERFGQLSNFKVNYSKTEALNISYDDSTLRHLKEVFPFRWQESSLKYLGTHITPAPGDLYKLNFLPILNRTLTDLQNYNARHLSWFGRINAVKMDVLPRFLYLFQTVPIILPSLFFKQLTRAINKFVWGFSRPRIKLSTLYLHKSKGGAGLPDFKKYHSAALLMRLVDWFRSPDKQWVQIEGALSPIPLTSLPWAGKPRSSSLITSLPFLTRQFYYSWNRILTSSAPISHKMGPMTPLFGNADFPPALDRESFLIWHRRDRIRLVQTLSPSHNLITYETLKNSCPGMVQPWLSYRQLSSFLTDSAVRTELLKDKTPFEGYLLLTSQATHVLSSIYDFMQNPPEPSSLPFVRAWEAELGVTFSEQEWLKSFILQHKLPVACFSQEKNYKILTRWYRYPTLLRRMYPSTSDCCWRCNAAPGTMLHIWWDCPPLLAFWNSIYALYNNLTGSNISVSPTSGLLTMLPGPISALKKGLLKHFLTAARTIIPRHWKSTTLPSRAEWLAELNSLMRMENLMAEDKGTTESFFRTWSVWSIYQDSQAFAAWLATGSLD